MRNRVHTMLMFIALLALPFVVPACAGGFGDPLAGRGADEIPSISELCGDRTVATLPQAGVLRATTTVVTDFDPADSALAKVLSVINDLNGCGDTPGGEVVEFEVGDDGVIVAINGEPDTAGRRFIIADGCLEIESDTPPDETGEDEAAADEAAQNQPLADDGGEDELCGADGIPIFQSIIGADPETDPYICVELREGDSCQDCGEDETGWTFTTRTIVTFRAMGSLSQVQAVDLCNSSVELVNIRVGQSVNAVITTATRFEYAEE